MSNEAIIAVLRDMRALIANVHEREVFARTIIDSEDLRDSTKVSLLRCLSEERGASWNTHLSRRLLSLVQEYLDTIEGQSNER